MSTAGDRASVLRTTKVRTKLKGDASWLQQRTEHEAETQEEKPWLAEVRARRLNGAPDEISPVSSPTNSTPPPINTDAERAPTSGFLIRGVFTKLDNPAPSSTSNGFSKTTQFTKKPSESYKRIAPHTVRPTSENQEGHLSLEEQEKRTEAASNVLKRSAVRQRSYVLSAAKIYESKDNEPDASPVNSSLSFVAKRVEITDDDESAVTPAPASAAPPSPVVPVTSVASAPEPKPWKTINTSVQAVNEPVAPKVEETTPDPVKEDPLPESVMEKDPFEGMKPGCTKVATPLPELITECIQAVSTESELEDSNFSGQADTSLVELSSPTQSPISPTPASPSPAVPVSPAPASLDLTSTVPVSPAPASLDLTSTVPESPAPMSPDVTSTVPESPAPMSPDVTSTVPESPAPMSPAPPSALPESPAPVSPDLTSTVPQSPVQVPHSTVSPPPASPAPVTPAPISPAPVSAVTELRVKIEPEPAAELQSDPEPEPEPKPSPNPSSGVETLTALADTLISFGTSSPSFKDHELALAKEKGTSVDSRTTENNVGQKPAPALSNGEPMTDDLLGFSDGPEQPAEPVPPSPGRWSQDLLGGLDSLSMQREEEKQTDETTKETQSKEDNADPWSSRATTTVTESSSADPFDPYPIGTTSPNSSSVLLQPLSHTSINSELPTSPENKDTSPEINMSSNALESLADDVIPINMDTTSTRRPWARRWETTTPQQTNKEDSREDEPEAGGRAKDPQTLVMFERKSTENDSPWDRWTSPTVYNITNTTEEEEEEQEEEEEEQEQEEEEDDSPEDTRTVTTITTIRDIQGEPEPAMDRSETYSRTVIEEEQRVQTPEPETKKGFVYVKEYVNATELSMHNARDSVDGGSDYLTSSSINYSYSSPSTYSRGPLSSTCMYCGEQVGNDAKITIEHLNINCHPACFKCGVCSKPMGDLLFSMFIHGGKVHCESCYAAVN